MAEEEKNAKEKIDRTTAMRYCLHCNDDAVYPVEWEEDGPEHWDVLLRCGNCDTYRRDTFHQLEVEDFDCWLDDTQDEIQNAWRKAEHRHMREDCEKFIGALQAGAIFPCDFNLV